MLSCHTGCSESFLALFKTGPLNGTGNRTPASLTVSKRQRFVKCREEGNLFLMNVKRMDKGMQRSKVRDGKREFVVRIEQSERGRGGNMDASATRPPKTKPYSPTPTARGGWSASGGPFA